MELTVQVIKLGVETIFSNTISQAQDLLVKNVSKEVCFWLRERLPCSASQRTQHCVNSGCSLFFWGSKGVSQVCLFVCLFVPVNSETNVFDAGFAHCLVLKDGVSRAIKDPGHDS